MAGLETGLKINMDYQKQWNGFPGSPTMQDATFDYNPGDRVGLGAIISADQTGLISTVRAMGTYAYHIPLSSDNDSKLNFGVSVGINNAYLDYNKIVGDPGDVSAQIYNQRPIYFDGDLGISYTSSGINIQAAVPNLRSVFFNTTAQSLAVDRTTFYTAVSYQYMFDEGHSGIMAEPKLALRGVKGFNNIGDAGVNFSIPDYRLNIAIMYHTNQSTTFNAGFFSGPVGFQFSYSINSAPIGTYEQDTFEVGLCFKFKNSEDASKTWSR